MHRLSTYACLVSKRTVQMREPTYFVLASLLSGPLHGYAIIKRTAELSGGRVRLATGTLYTALDRLTGEGLVEQVGEEIVSGRTRRSYALTGAGASAVRAEALRMAEASRVVTDPAGPGRDPAAAPPSGRAARRVRPA
jgi:PadR family transcriptional regulator, regulatory protein PadR